MSTTKIHIDSDLDTIAIAGIRYSLGLFRTLGLAPIGSVFKIIRRDPDGILVLQRQEPPYTTLEVPPAHTYMGRVALADIALERQRQIDAEGFVPEHDDRYQDESLAVAAACYVLAPIHQMPSIIQHRQEGEVETRYEVPRHWPWNPRWWKPGPVILKGWRRRHLVKAAALLVAEIERLDRLETSCRRFFKPECIFGTGCKNPPHCKRHGLCGGNDTPPV